jgi:hypothetical protein
LEPKTQNNNEFINNVLHKKWLSSLKAIGINTISNGKDESKIGT